MSRRHWPLLVWPIAGCAVGVGVVAAEMVASAKLFLLAVPGLAGCVLVFLKPEIGLLLTVFAIPLEKLGRFTGTEGLTVVSVAKILGLFTLVGFLYRTLVRKERFILPREFVLLCLFWLVALSTLLHTSDLHFGINRVLSLLATFSFYFLIVNLVRTERLLRLTLLSLIISTTLMGLFALAQRYLPQFTIQQKLDIAYDAMGVYKDYSEEETMGIVVERSGGTSGSPHVYAANLLVAVPILMYLTRMARYPWTILAAAGACSLALVNLFLTQTRAAVLVLIVISAFGFYKRLIRLNPVWVLAVCILLALVLPFAPESLFERVLNLESYTQKGSGTLETRLSYWRSGVEMLKTYWLFGMGIGNFTVLPEYNYWATPGFGMMHNIYLQMFNEVGIFGFTALMLFLCLSWKSFGVAERNCLRSGNDSMALLASALKISFLALLILGLSMDFLHFAVKDWWLIAATAVVVRNLSMPPRTEEASSLT